MTLRLILLAVFSSPILAEALLSINISIPGFPLNDMENASIDLMDILVNNKK